LDIAIEWLRETLTSGPLAATEVLDMAKAEGIANKTLQRASKSLRVRKLKLAMEAGWWWSLPSKVANAPEDAQVSDLATFGEVGHLRKPESGMAEVEL
jgi:hypothetical protein